MFGTTARFLARAATGSAEAGFNRLIKQDHIRLAVTGLSRAGKTVFITSLIHNLLAMAGGARCLPALAQGPHGPANRLVSAEILPAGAEAIPRFPFERNLDAMAGHAPIWPERTSGLSRITVKLVLRRQSGLGAALFGTREVFLEILDYPGEWLLDLPMLQQSWADWSSETLARLERPGLHAQSAAFLSLIQRIDPDQPASDEAAMTAHLAYKALLQRLRSERGLSFLQPGRFLTPGVWGDVPALWFCPLPKTGNRVKPGSLAALFAERYDAYGKMVQAQFFQPYFEHFDRQILLVDLLGALHASAEAFQDLGLAIDRLTGCFRYGGGALNWLFRDRIDRVMIAATKADYVPGRQRDALPILLENLAPTRSGQMARTELRMAALAATRCTRDADAVIDGRAVQVVAGLPMGRDKIVKFFPGDVPLKPPGPEFWDLPFFEMPVFQPPVLEARGSVGVPHLGLDEVAQFLFGDRL